jgi:hemin uptake protein HemP
MNRPDTPEESEMKSEARSPGGERAAVATVDARKLLGESGILRIDLDGELYTLRVTRNNRLILTK